MHALCTVVASSPNAIHQVIYDQCECRNWDYASIGGRYDRIIPVSKKTKDIITHRWDSFSWMLIIIFLW